MPKVLIPLPRRDFDPTEVAIPWQQLKEHSFDITFATPDAREGIADPIMVHGRSLGPLKWILRADKNALRAYDSLIQAEEFKNPISYDQIKEGSFDGILLPGGHAQGMREYLESDLLQSRVSEFFSAGKPVGAICHGVVLLARSPSDATGKSVLQGRRVTCLLQSQELLAWNLTRLWKGNYYRTYLDKTVESEVRASLAGDEDFSSGPTPLSRDSNENLERGFVCEDGALVTARWPGDAHRFSHAFARLFR